jgi:hypothetical protein
VRHLRIVFAVALLAGGFSVLGMAAPDCAYACSCIQPKPIAEYANDPDTFILTGTVTAVDQQSRQGSFRVDRWFKGSSDIAEIPIRSGDGADCGIPLTVGQELVMVAFVGEGILEPSICSPWGDLSTAEGKQLRDDTLTAYGEGTAPGGAETPGEVPEAGFSIPTVVLIGGAAILGIVVIVAGASLLSARRDA